MLKISSKTKSQNNQKSEVIQLMIKSLVDQYSLPEVISCVFSNPCKHKELRKIIDFLIKEEGKLNIIQYLLHLNEFKSEEINNIQELDDSKGENIE